MHRHRLNVDGRTHGDVSSSKLESIRRLRRVDLDYARSEGSVFQAAIDVFSGLADTIRDWMVGCAREGVSSCCRKNEGIRCF